MRIVYGENPLWTSVLLNEFEKKELWYRVKIAEMEDVLFSAQFHLEEGQYFDLDRARHKLKPDYWCVDEGQSNLDKRVDILIWHYMSALKDEPHVGDCTCVASSCVKCAAEVLLGIDTLKIGDGPSLSKYAAAKIEAVYRDNPLFTCEEAIAYMESHFPVVKEEWHRDYIEKWKVDHQVAIDWLKEYMGECRDRGFVEVSIWERRT